MELQSQTDRNSDWEIGVIFPLNEFHTVISHDCRLVDGRCIEKESLCEQPILEFT